MTSQQKDQVVLSGAVDFAHRQDSITISPAQGVGSYPPFDVRFVDGRSYIEIDAAVQRPPTIHPDTRWIEFDQRPGVVPVPNRALPPEVPIETVGLPLTQPMVDTHFLDAAGSDPRRVSVRFRRGQYSGSIFTYSIDRHGRIISVRDDNVPDEQGVVFNFEYGPTSRKIVAPTTGVQRIPNGDNLYPTPTSTPAA